MKTKSFILYFQLIFLLLTYLLLPRIILQPIKEFETKTKTKNKFPSLIYPLGKFFLLLAKVYSWVAFFLGGIFPVAFFWVAFFLGGFFLGDIFPGGISQVAFFRVAFFWVAFFLDPSAISCHWKMFRPKYVFQKTSHSIFFTYVPRD